eukprot:TRINITY_DN7102_c1_g1_i1.p1 TRINITY_DN7102_c1_g1~~TRINITY_DN7102_c1_g1_i1.p1  ORF type:complete len:132 (-),score=27.00 TRINITY_DN7102_c1_g1_i1:87-482(-)
MKLSQSVLAIMILAFAVIINITFAGSVSEQDDLHAKYFPTHVECFALSSDSSSLPCNLNSISPPTCVMNKDKICKVSYLKRKNSVAKSETKAQECPCGSHNVSPCRYDNFTGSVRCECSISTGLNSNGQKC